MDDRTVAKCQVDKKETVAQEVMNYLDRIAGQAEKTSSRLEDQLGSVCRRDTPNEEVASAQPEREYPPYFVDFRERLRNIDYAMHRINDVMDRCEI